MSGALLSSKIIVVEEEPRVRGIPALPTSIAGAVGVTERGPIGEATLCTSYEEFTRVFGGFTQNADLTLAAMGFFENGGTHLWVVRTVHYTDAKTPASKTSTAATGKLKTGTTDTATIDGKTDGAYGNNVKVKTEAATSGESSEFNLRVSEGGTYKELFTNLSMAPKTARYAETIINNDKAGSNLIKFTDLKSGTPPANRPDNQVLSLTGGGDGLTSLADTDFVGSSSGKTGLYALDRVQDLSLLMVPGRATSAVHNAMVAYCEVTRDGAVFAVLDPPANQSATSIITYVGTTASLQNLTEFAAIYWPRVKILNPSKTVFGSSEQIVVPPSGIITGVYARTDSAKPGGVYDPPAGIEKGRMFGVLGFETKEVLEEAKRDLVYPKRINPLTTGPGLPRFIDGSRTLKGGGNFPYVAERRGVIFIERSLKQGLQFARHKNNTEGLRAQVRRTITAFLLIQMNNGAFRSREPQKAFFVDVSDALNTPTMIFAGRLIARVGLATNKPAEFLILKISQDTRALEAELAAATS